MKKYIVFPLMLCFSIISGQIKTPQPSPTATITQKIGVSNVSVEYSRPGAKGREIFGGLVKYGKIWRTGANKATKITFEEDVIFGGKSVKKGSYSLFTIPGEKKWTVLLNKETELWGSGDYDENMQICSFTSNVEKSKDFIETFTIEFGSFNSFDALMSIKWTNIQINIKIQTTSAKKIEKNYYELLTKGPSANDYYNGAKFFVDNTSKYELALEWINIAIEKREDAFWMLYHKARILNKMGENKEAIVTAQLTIELASKEKDDYGYIKKSKDLILKIKTGPKKID